MKGLDNFISRKIRAFLKGKDFYGFYIWPTASNFPKMTLVLDLTFLPVHFPDHDHTSLALASDQEIFFFFE